MFLSDFIKDVIRKALEGVVPNAAEVEIKVEYPAEISHGDFATNIALAFSKMLGMQPRVLAEKILENIISQNAPFIQKAEIAGPGFINIFLSPTYLNEEIVSILEHPEYGKNNFGEGKTVVTDTSHPNIAKPMGVHHLLSTIIGNSINNILKASGYTVIRDNYMGDWGTQYGKLMWAYKNWGDEVVVKKDPIPELQKLYVRFHEEVEARPELEDLGRAEFKKLEDGDEESRKLWKRIVDLSLVEFNKIYKRLGVTFDYIHGESFYEDKMQEIIDLGIKKGLFVEGEKKAGQEHGALIFPFEHEKYPPCIIRKSDGATIYATRDLARTKYWEDTWHPDMMIIVADTAQELHFKQFFEVAAALGITKAPNIHAWFGRMSFPEKKMSTRKGDIILMEELLDEAEEHGLEIVKEKNPELALIEQKEIARVVGIGAVKYAVLAQNRHTNVTFTWDKMLSLDGNSAPYIQYVHARAWSILTKNGVTTTQELLVHDAALLTEQAEVTLARLLPRFSEIIAFAAQELKPNLLTNYLFQLASQFNSFYGAVNVMKSEGELKQARLRLVAATAQVLKNGLGLLGIEAPLVM